MMVSNPSSLIKRELLVSFGSKIGGSGAKFGGSWDCDIAKLAVSLNTFIFIIYLAAMLYKFLHSFFQRTTTSTNGDCFFALSPH
jgi:hypothetical protein